VQGARTLAERFEMTRRNWNERTPIHAASDFYDVDGFRAGRITLTDIERDELGPVYGKSLLHLQCHFGMDTMSWARLGAQATGVDISDASIDLARRLNDELGLDARFIRANVYDLPALLEERFDIVYTAIGAICWLPDLAAWAALVARFLKPGGTFYMLEVHPASMIFEAAGSDADGWELRPAYSYFPEAKGLLDDGLRPSYAGAQPIKTPVYEWQHSLSEVVNALIGVGLAIERLGEFPVAPFQAFPQMRRQDGWWRLGPSPASKSGADAPPDSIPFLYSIKATAGAA
jgi:SAM-dependent methyltransferase